MPKAIGAKSESLGHLQAAKKDRVTHRIEISSVEQIDYEVKKWLKTAYDLDQ